jgi:hypothetical protein
VDFAVPPGIALRFGAEPQVRGSKMFSTFLNVSMAISALALALLALRDDPAEAAPPAESTAAAHRRHHDGDDRPRHRQRDRRHRHDPQRGHG